MLKENYENLRLEQLKIKGKGVKVLLHSCCAPCSSACLERLVDFASVTVFYYNPNIDNQSEFELRLNEQKNYLNSVYGDKVKLFIPHYDSKEFYEATRGHEDAKEGGSRCELCFKLRLEKTAQYAAENNFDFFATTLTVSPLKNARLINRIGKEIGEKCNVQWLYSDFKKQNGYLRSIALSKENGLYRQDYCGCSFSQKEAAKRRKVDQ